MFQPISGELNRPVARRHAHHQAAAGQLIDRCGCLGKVDGVTQRDNGAAGRQRHVLRTRGQVRKIGERVEHLPGVSKGRIEQGHVADPHGSEALPVDLADQVGLAGKHAHVARIAAQRQEDANGQFIRREHATVARVCVKRGVGRAARVCGEVGCVH
ncbi:hypothetical protein D3C72_1784210 [compost metagenome]